VRICVIFNPSAKGEKARRFQHHLDAIGADCTLKLTQTVGDARRLAGEAVRDNFETIVAAGGDGTLNEVINGIGDEPSGLERTRLGLLPLGTVNVFAKELGIPIKTGLAWQTIRRRRETLIDLPAVEFSSGGSTERRYFAQLAGTGLDARAIEMVSWPLKKKFGPLAYVVAGLKALLGKQSQITAAAATTTDTGELILIGNGRFYGGRFTIFPEADVRDGLLEVCVFPRVNWLTLALCAWPLLTSGFLPKNAVRRFRSSGLTLASSSQAALELDGDLVGYLPATFSMTHQKLRVIVP
jgi:YegS/Rv2252/BmrU family lipid kinase